MLFQLQKFYIVEWGGNVITNIVYVGIWIAAVMTHFELASWHFLGENEGKPHKTSVR
jgi:hypothetical protein